MTRVVDKNEVSLYGVRFPILGTVRDSLINPFPGKITIGDYTRDDEQVASSWVMADWSGGLGVRNGQFPQDQDRYDFGTLETRYPRQLSLPPLVRRRSGEALIAHFIDYDGQLYAFAEQRVLRWSEAAGSFSQIQTLAAPVSDVALYDDGSTTWLVVAQGDGVDLTRFNGTAWSAVTGIAGRHLIVWDDKLFVMRGDGSFRYTVDLTTSVAAGRLRLPATSIRQLILFFDAQGDRVIHVVTDRGLWGYDFANLRFWETALSYPVHPQVGRAAEWRGSLYLPVGASVYRWDGQAIQMGGPDRQDGLPAEYRGAVRQLIPTHPYLFALVTVAEDDPAARPMNLIQLGSPSNTRFFAPLASRGLLLSSPGTGWHGAFTEGEIGYRMGCAGVSNAEGAYRLWLSSSRGVYSLDLPLTAHNPLRNPVQEFAPSGVVYTSWFDAGWAELDKLALGLRVTAPAASATESATIHAQWDGEPLWRHLGRIAEPGRFVFDIERYRGGRLFRRVRFRIELERGDDPRQTPVLASVALSFLRMPKAMWGYQFTIDLSRDYKGLTRRELTHALEDALKSGKAGFFAYLDEELGREVEKLVVFSRQGGAQVTGRISDGRATVSVLEVSGDERLLT